MANLTLVQAINLALVQEMEEEPARTSPLRSLMTFVWVALAIGISVVRACGDSQP